MASYGARWANGDGEGALAGARLPLLSLGLGASLLIALPPVLFDEAVGVRASFAATLLLLALAARSLARRGRGPKPGARALALAAAAPLFVALGACLGARAQGVVLALPLALPLFGLAVALERLEARPRWRGRARGLLAIGAALGLAGFWAYFWAVDLGQARARVVLVPAQAFATAAAAFGFFRPGGRPVAPGRLALGGGGLGLGVAYAWLAARAESVGCVGVSPAYEATLLATAILLFGLGPLAAEAG